MNKKDFQYSVSKFITTSKRAIVVFIAGIGIGMAVAATTVTHDMSDMSIREPLEQVITNTHPSVKTPAIDILLEKTISLIEEATSSRAARLESVILTHGKSKMNQYQLQMWSEIVEQAAKLPFSDVYAQFDPYSESFYVAYTFNSGQRLETTTYADEEDTDVYFSVRSDNKVFFQNVLPRAEFFERAASTWLQFGENFS